MKHLLSLFCLCFAINNSLYAEEDSLPNAVPAPAMINKPIITPTPPSVNAKAYILIDVDSGKIIAEKESSTKLPPASLTKMMTLYVLSNALNQQKIHLDSMVRVSETAWKAEGSRMFIKEGDEVSVQDLIKGIIVDSGNDACVAMAEYVGGSEASFADIMNQQAQQLGMKDSHFTDSTGLPNPDLYTTAKDLAILGRALINHFPEYYGWYQQKWFTYNGIKQPNRNRLLWRNSQVDGIKTGHTDEAGFCLVSSAKRDKMRLLAVILGAPSDNVRADDSERLLNYGFRFFETHALYQEGQTIQEIPLYKGSASKLPIGTLDDVMVTVPTGQLAHVRVNSQVSNLLQAPIQKHQHIGDLVVQLDNTPIATYPLYALRAIDKGGMLTRAKDTVRLTFKRWLS